MEQFKFDFDKIIPEGWKQAEKHHIGYCVEEALKIALGNADVRGICSAAERLCKMYGYDMPKQVDVEDKRQTKRTKEEHYAAMREAGLDPEILGPAIVEQVLK